MYEMELKIAQQAGRVAAEIIARHFIAQDFEVSHKSVEQPVTVADLEANAAILKIIQEAFPEDGILSEEIADNRERLHKSRVWIFDPLDGTKDFIERNPEFAVSIALIENQRPVVGVVVNPATSEMFWATAGGGAFDRDGLLQVKNFSEAQKIELLVSRTEYRRGEWQKFETDYSIRATGGCAYKMALIAKGVAHACFTLQPKNEWDVAAGCLLVREAGGDYARAHGEPVHFNKENTRFLDFAYGNKKALQKIFLNLKNTM